MKLGQLTPIITMDGIDVKDGGTGKTVAFGYTENRHDYDDADVLKVWPDISLSRMLGFSRSIKTVLCCYIDHADYERLKTTK